MRGLKSVRIAVLALGTLGGAVAAQASGAAIVGGKSISITEAPWQLKMNASGAGCGAAWIGGRWALTAAHCVEDATASSTYFWAGITRSRDMNNTNRVQAARILMFATNWTNPWRDIALVQLNADITAPLARPIRWATPADVSAGAEAVGKECMASGWGGTTRDITPFPDSLQGVTSKVKRLETYVIHWAAQGGTQPVGSCQGDSGGPLVVKDAGGNWILAGISSFISSYCGNPNSESSYARVSAFASWIQQNTGGFTSLRPGSQPTPWIAFGPDGIRLEGPGAVDLVFRDLGGARVWRSSGFRAAGWHALPALPAGLYTVTARAGSRLARNPILFP